MSGPKEQTDQTGSGQALVKQLSSDPRMAAVECLTECWLNSVGKAGCWMDCAAVTVTTDLREGG